jgi:two-component system, NarL family, invasion response regulator UvrY
VIRVAIIDDHPLVRRGLREALATDSSITVVAEAGRSDEVLTALGDHPCDVLLLDLSLPGRGGIDVLADVRRQFPSVRTLIVSSHDNATQILRAIRAGAAGYLTKAAPEEELLRAIHSVHRTGRHISDAVGAVLAEFAQGGGETGTIGVLSDREVEVMLRLAKGESVSAIADALSLSVKTISTYRSRLLEKLGLTSTADLVRYAIDHHLID